MVTFQNLSAFSFPTHLKTNKQNKKQTNIHLRLEGKRRLSLVYKNQKNLNNLKIFQFLISFFFFVKKAVIKLKKHSYN